MKEGHRRPYGRSEGFDGLRPKGETIRTTVRLGTEKPGTKVNLSADEPKGCLDFLKN